MNLKKISALLLLMLTPVVGVLLYQHFNAGPVVSESPVPTVATVAGRAITTDDFTSKMIRRSGGFAGQFSTIEQKQLLLDEMINYELQVARAREAGYADDPRIVTKLERIMVGKLREEQLQQELAKVSVSETEIENYYQQHLANYTRPPMSRIAAIQIKISQGASEEKRAEQRSRANEVLEAASLLPASARGFGTLAAKHSDHQPSRYIGGDVGWYSSDKGGRFMNPEIRQAVMAITEQNELSPVIKADDGYYLLKLTDIRDEQIKPLAEVQGGITHSLLSNKRAQVEASWLAGLKQDDMPIQINLSALEAVPSPHGATVQKKRLQPAALPNG